MVSQRKVKGDPLKPERHRCARAARAGELVSVVVPD